MMSCLPSCPRQVYIDKKRKEATMVTGIAQVCEVCGGAFVSCVVGLPCLACEMKEREEDMKKSNEIKKTLEATEKVGPIPMSANEYQRLAQRTECDQNKSASRMGGLMDDGWLDTKGMDNLLSVRFNHAVIGMMGEVGELASILEKWIYYGQELNKDKIEEEAGDLLWYVAQLLNAAGLSLQTVMERNIIKLRIRYPDKFSELKALRRDVEAEKVAMSEVGDAVAVASCKAMDILREIEIARGYSVNTILNCTHDWQSDGYVFRCKHCKIRRWEWEQHKTAMETGTAKAIGFQMTEEQKVELGKAMAAELWPPALVSPKTLTDDEIKLIKKQIEESPFASTLMPHMLKQGVVITKGKFGYLPPQTIACDDNLHTFTEIENTEPTEDGRSVVQCIHCGVKAWHDSNTNQFTAWRKNESEECITSIDPTSRYEHQQPKTTEPMEPCCECGNDYPASDLKKGYIYCADCRCLVCDGECFIGERVKANRCEACKGRGVRIITVEGLDFPTLIKIRTEKGVCSVDKSHQWRRQGAHTRCFKCGAHPHLGSGMMKCTESLTEKWDDINLPPADRSGS